MQYNGARVVHRCIVMNYSKTLQKTAGYMPGIIMPSLLGFSVAEFGTLLVRPSNLNTESVRTLGNSKAAHIVGAVPQYTLWYILLPVTCLWYEFVKSHSQQFTPRWQ